MDIPDVRAELKSARDQLALTQDDETGLISKSSQQFNNDDDVHMFYPGFDENTNVNEDHKVINTMFLNTSQYHKDRTTMESEDMDRDMTTIIGILRHDELDMISHQAVCFLLQ